MCRRLISLVSSILVLSVASRVNADLVGHWKLDEGSGTTVLDSSGNGNDGITVNNPTWIPGVNKGALEFHGLGTSGGGGDYINCGNDASLDITGPISIALWIRPDADDPEGKSTTTAPMAKAMSGMSPSWSFQVRYGWGQGAPEPNMAFTFPPAGGTPRAWAFVGKKLERFEWCHIACSFDGSTLRCFLNGEQTDSTPMGGTTSSSTPVLIGSDGWGCDWIGAIDEVRIYNHALTVEEIQQAMLVVPQAESSNLSPRDGAKDVPQEVALTWRAGDYVEGLSPKHRVFFSENFDDVNDGIGGIEQDVERYPIDVNLSLDFGKTYYWRVDEANSTAGWDVGALWRFTVIDHFVVDGFEDYADNPADAQIFNNWIDGWEVPENGALVGHDADLLQGEHYVETTIVHGGKQAMPYYYDNTGTATNSQAQRTFIPAQDWTREGVGVLSLWFRGYPAYVGSFGEAPPGTYTMTASGADIWATSDEFHFAYKEASGAVAIIAKVESVENMDPWAKAGVMIRDTLDADSRYAGVLVTPENGVRFQYRNNTGGTTSRYFAEGITAPQWVRLERTTGGLVRAFYSADGTTWTNFNLVQVRMDMPVYMGLALTSHEANLTCEAKFSNVSFPNTTVGPQWTDQDVGITSNEAEPMYVTAEDGSGTAATVYHNDPDAALINTWTQWTIDTKEFGDAGVVLTDVSKLGIGFGGADNPKPGGSGLVYFDDIRLYLPAQ